MAPDSSSKTRAGPSKCICASDSPATLTTAPFGASEPVRMLMPPASWIGASRGCTTTPSRGRWVELREVLGHRLAGHRHHVAVQEPGLEQQLEHDRHTADPIEVAHVELAAGLHVGDVRNTVGDAVEVVEVERNPGLVGKGEQVQHCVGRPAEGRRHGDRILERLLGHDLARGDAEPQLFDDGGAGAFGISLPTVVDGRW